MGRLFPPLPPLQPTQGSSSGHWVALWHHQYFWWVRVPEWAQFWLHSYTNSGPLRVQSASVPFSAALGMAAVQRFKGLGMLALPGRHAGKSSVGSSFTFKELMAVVKPFPPRRVRGRCPHPCYSCMVSGWSTRCWLPATHTQVSHFALVLQLMAGQALVTLA